MSLGRTYRLGEASLTLLFFLQSLRLATGRLLLEAERAVGAGALDQATILLATALAIAVGVPAFSSRRKTALPETISVSAIVVALARMVAAIQLPTVQAVAALVAVAAGGVYLASLLRANRQTWLLAWIVSLSLDQLMHAYDTFDLSLRSWLEVRMAGVEAFIPWLAMQAVLSAVVIVLSRLARGEARHEPYRPARLTAAGGAALGGFLALEMVALAVPGVLARWTLVSRAGIAPLVLLATVLPLLPAVRRQVGGLLHVFDERVQGLVWVIVLMLLVAAGNRSTGPGAVLALSLAQMMAVMLLWQLFVPVEPGSEGVDRTGWTVTLGLAAYVVLVGGYSLASAGEIALPVLQGQATTILLAAAALLGVPRLLTGRGEAPWSTTGRTPVVLLGGFVVPVLALIALLAFPSPGQPEMDGARTLRVATYNLNGGYDTAGYFALEAAAQTIEAARPDVVLLQEADVGRPISYSVDEVAYLARRLGMHETFFPAPGRERGLAVLSAWPLNDVSGVALSSTDADAVLAARISTGESPDVTVVDAALSPATDDEQLRQLAVLLGMFGEGEAVVVGGTLVPPEQSLPYQQLTLRGFVDPVAALRVGPGDTYPASDPTERRDYLLAQGMVPLDARQVDSQASDHRLFVIELGWPAD